MTSLFAWTRSNQVPVAVLEPARFGACRKSSLMLRLILLTFLFCEAPLAGGERAPELRPEFPPWAPYPGLPLNQQQSRAWNDADHWEASAAGFALYTNNYTLRRVKNREDTYLRARGRLAMYTAPGDPGFHFSVAGEAARVQFLKHNEFSGNEFAGALNLRLGSDAFRFEIDYTGGQRLVPDEDHFSLAYRSYHENRVVHDATGLFAIGVDGLGAMGETHLRAADYPGLLGSRNDVIATENVVRVGLGLDRGGAGVFTREIFPLDFRFQQHKGRFDARPMQRYADTVVEMYGLEYLGTVHLLNPDNLGAGAIDPAIALAWGLGIQARYEDFFMIRAEGGPMRFEVLGDNSRDHPGWQTAYWNLRAVIVPWDALEAHLQSHSGISELRGVAYAQDIETTLGLTWFLNRNLDTGIDYSYITMIASRHDFGQEGDRLLLHAAWRYAEGWAT
ncbi:MAG TPA: hypothetical protein VL860_11235, partial [Planctomycetota bacterium]|nr:hypothetical protein [Planctomycetota bacterium]